MPQFEEVSQFAKAFNKSVARTRRVPRSTVRLVVVAVGCGSGINTRTYSVVRRAATAVVILKAASGGVPQFTCGSAIKKSIVHLF